MDDGVGLTCLDVLQELIHGTDRCQVRWNHVEPGARKHAAVRACTPVPSSVAYGSIACREDPCHRLEGLGRGVTDLAGKWQLRPARSPRRGVARRVQALAEERDLSLDRARVAAADRAGEGLGEAELLHVLRDRCAGAARASSARPRAGRRTRRGAPRRSPRAPRRRSRRAPRPRDSRRCRASRTCAASCRGASRACARASRPPGRPSRGSDRA